MLAGLEDKFGAIIADGLASRAHIDVVGGAPLPPQQGRASVGAAIEGIETEDGFSPSDTLMIGPPDSPQSRRVLPVQFVANIAFQLRPASGTATARNNARALILEDVSAVAHLLGDRSVADGSAFAVADPDPGFLVTRLRLEEGKAEAEQEDDLFTASLRYRGEARIWPVGAAQDEGVIGQLDTVIAALPLILSVGNTVLLPETETRVRGEAGRLMRDDGDGAGDPANIAVSVRADVPIAERGTILGGAPGNETGVTILPLDEQGTIDIRYRAPSEDPPPNGRTEYVAVHLATPDGNRGIFLGLAALRLVPAP